LFAALNTATGEVLGKTAPRHTSEQFVAFLADVVATQPEQREIHVICDNVSSHKTDLVAEFLASHEQVQIHYTPTYSSWLNQVENWFSRIQRDVISRGIFTSLKDRTRSSCDTSVSTTRTQSRSSGSTTIPIADTANSSDSVDY